MLNKLGFFHFAQGHDDPFGCLAEALNKKSVEHDKGDIGGSLIVLPEAFNLGMKYYPHGWPSVSRTTGCAKVSLDRALENLHDIAGAHRIVFVAGLIGEQFSS